MTPLERWQTFYVIAGSSAGALTGLQFVVIALIADMPVTRGVAAATDAFTTPTITHFGAVLLISSVLTAPWPGMAGPSLASATCGAAGIAYIAVVLRRMVSQPAYKPVFEDWLFHIVLPMIAYGSLVAAGYAAWQHPDALFGTAAAVLLLLFIGVHNAWDGVTYLVFVRRPEVSKGSNASTASSDRRPGPADNTNRE